MADQLAKTATTTADEVIDMSTYPHIRPRDSSFFRNGGAVWTRLHQEREDVCAVLLAEYQTANDLTTGWQEVNSPSEDAVRDLEWRHRELLQSRLRRIDDALDRLIAGSYGRCCECDKVIDDKRLTADAAASFCVVCQLRKEGENRFQKL